jgi:hypothetical protein
MIRRRQCIVFCAASALVLPVAMAHAADKSQFKPEGPERYGNAQKVSGLVLAADSYHDPERAKVAFGSKTKPQDHGILPIYLVIRNDSTKTINLKDIRVEYHADRARSAAIPPGEVPYVGKATRPPKVDAGGPIPGRVRVRRGKNTLEAREIQELAFMAPVLPPGETASGFFYFQGLYRENAILFITGLKEAGSGQELFYMEVPVNNGPDR